MKEFDLIRKLIAPSVKYDGALGLTDDVSLLPGFERPSIITTDTLVSGVHFLPTDPLDSVGQKLVRVNVSDCLAKGALPRLATLNLTLPHGFSDDDAKSLMDGVTSDLSAFDIMLIGGDTTSAGNDLVLSMTMIGECVGDGPVRRSGARVGDDVWVTGTIGDAGLGLKVATTDPENTESLLSAYRIPPVPSREISECIAKFATGSVDVSDGLLADLTHITESSGCGAVLQLEAVPVSSEAREYMRSLDGQITVEDLIGFGDDYQCLFTASLSFRDAISDWSLKHGISLSRIGQIVDKKGVDVRDSAGNPVKVLRAGWQHETSQ